MLALSPALEPMLRSTTPASRANAENVASSSGTAMFVVKMFRLLPVTKLRPIQLTPMSTITSSVIAMLPMGLLMTPTIASRRGRPGVWVPGGAGKRGAHRADLFRR